MGDPRTTIWQEVSQGAGKIIMWMVLISGAVIAKLAADSRVAKLTRRDIIIKTILSVFIGVLAALYCEEFGYQKWGKIIVPVSTLLGEGVVVYGMTNWRKLLSKLMPNIFPTTEKKKQEEEPKDI